MLAHFAEVTTFGNRDSRGDQAGDGRRVAELQNAIRAEATLPMPEQVGATEVRRTGRDAEEDVELLLRFVEQLLHVDVARLNAEDLHDAGALQRIVAQLIAEQKRIAALLPLLETVAADAARQHERCVLVGLFARAAAVAFEEQTTEVVVDVDIALELAALERRAIRETVTDGRDHDLRISDVLIADEHAHERRQAGLEDAWNVVHRTGDIHADVNGARVGVRIAVAGFPDLLVDIHQVVTPCGDLAPLNAFLMYEIGAETGSAEAGRICNVSGVIVSTVTHV